MVSPRAAANRDGASESIRVYPNLSAGDAVSESICKPADPEAATDSDVDRLGCRQTRMYPSLSASEPRRRRGCARHGVCCTVLPQRPPQASESLVVA